jgi:hypothetical protein
MGLQRRYIYHVGVGKNAPRRNGKMDLSSHFKYFSAGDYDLRVGNYLVRWLPGWAFFLRESFGETVSAMAPKPFYILWPAFSLRLSERFIPD